MLKKDCKLFISLVLWALVPSVYLLIRMNIVTVNGVDINILGQMEWFELIDEVIVTALTVPLYHLLKPEKSSKEQNGFIFLVAFEIYLSFTMIISFRVGNIAEFMNAAYASRYLLLQSISMLISFIGTFMVLLFTLNDDYKTIRTLLLTKIGLLCVADYFLISNFADAGASYSEILVNSLISLSALVLAYSRKYISVGKYEKSILKDWVRIGIPVGIQIFLDNFIYAVMICKMVNAVTESGNYWVANNFIWGWLLVPVSCLAEIIRKNNLEKLTFKNTWIYGLGIIGLWIITMPGWNWFITNAMASDASVILKIVYPNVVFYLTYIVTAFIDAWFVSKGKTIYIAVISFVVNIIYYGIVYLLFKQGIFTENMNFIILMFGGGMVVHLIMSEILYFWENKKVRK